MLLSDMGADVVRVERPGARPASQDITLRGRRTVELDLKVPEARDAALRLIAKADGVTEGFRPGVMERLGLGPEHALASNPRIVYGRMTGWGQEGPLALAAGHDINYISLPGALAAIGPAGGGPVPPLNLVGDYGGGALYLVVGLLAALLHARSSGHGQVVDAAMCDGVASLMTQFMTMASMGRWRERRGSNLLDGGAHFYRTYECAAGGYVAVGAIEPQFYALLRQKAGLGDPAFDAQMDPGRWPELTSRLQEIFLTKTREEWCAIFDGSDACVTPVLTLSEAAEHPHLAARQTLVSRDGLVQPAPAPRFSRTHSAIQGPPAQPPVSVDDVLAGWG
jgi:alpha-methylacyl-CoA racemase